MEQLQSEYRLISSLIDNMLVVYGSKCYSDKTISSEFEKLKSDRVKVSLEIIKLRRRMKRN